MFPVPAGHFVLGYLDQLMTDRVVLELYYRLSKLVAFVLG